MFILKPSALTLEMLAPPINPRTTCPGRTFEATADGERAGAGIAEETFTCTTVGDAVGCPFAQPKLAA